MWFEYDDEDDVLGFTPDFDEIRDEVLYLQTVVDDVLGHGVVYLGIVVNDFSDYCCVFQQDHSTAITTDSVESLIELLLEEFPEEDWSALYE